MDARAAYDELVTRSRERALLNSCAGLLGWDEQTYLPRGGAEYRGDQMALLAGMTHERSTDPRINELLEIAEAATSGGFDVRASANIREWRRGYERLTRLPRNLVEEMARTTTLAQQAWVDARKHNDFAAFRPWLTAIIDQKRHEAACLSSGGELYDALLDEYEPGASAKQLAPLFQWLKAQLVPLVASITSANAAKPVEAIRGDFPVDRQKVFGEIVAAAVGFDFERGRLDTTAHPFCSGIGPGDVRITTRFDPSDFTSSFFGILHEVGHGLYEQGLDPAHYGQAVGEAVSLGIHESQSRLWENAVGRSLSFWTYWLPFAKSLFHETLGGVDLSVFHRSINRVEPSLIRVEADEVTYNLHILIRFELERALVGDSLAVKDLPDAWNALYQENLGITPPDFAQGCLQDIHWSAGLVGYFPTYTLGNIYAAQLFEKAGQELGDLDAQFARGQFANLLDWLRQNVHRHGQTYRASELVRRVTGSDIDPKPLVRSLKTKYSTIHSL